MNGVLYGADDDIAAWVHRRVEGVDPFPDGTVAMGMLHRNKVVAGVVFHDYRGYDISITVAADSPRWARRGVLRQLAKYPFTQLGCVRLTSIVSSENHRAQRLNLGLGMTLEGTQRRGFDGVHDALLFGVLREQCEWAN